MNDQRCTPVNTTRETGWTTTAICVPNDSPYQLYWSSNGPIDGMGCVKWTNPSRAAWSGVNDVNYLCAPTSGSPYPAGDQYLLVTTSTHRVH